MFIYIINVALCGFKVNATINYGADFLIINKFW